MPAFAAKSFAEEKAAFLQVCSDIQQTEDPQLQVGRLHDALRAACPEALQDEEVALACVGLQGQLLGYFCEPLRSKRSFILAVAQGSRGMALEYTSEELRGDREVVLAAVRRCGFELQWASAELQEDKELVLEAVTKDPTALEYACEGLRADREVVLAAARDDNLHSYVLECMHKELADDQAFLLLVARCARHISPRSCYRKASARVKKVLTIGEFCLAAESALAVPGQPQPAPTLVVTLTIAAGGAADGSGFHAEATNIVSSEKLDCDIAADQSRAEGPVLNDLALKLVATLKRLDKMDERLKHVFVSFQTSEGDELVVVTPWDCQRPLSEFLCTNSTEP